MLYKCAIATDGDSSNEAGKPYLKKGDEMNNIT